MRRSSPICRCRRPCPGEDAPVFSDDSNGNEMRVLTSPMYLSGELIANVQLAVSLRSVHEIASA